MSKLTLFDCVNAYTALMALHTQEWDYKSAYAIVTLKRKLQPHAEFFAEEEMKLVNEHAAKDENGKIVWTATGKFQFENGEHVREYEAARKALGAVEVDEEFTPLRLPLPQRITPQHLEALENLIIFEEGENG